jgi:transcriptional regulator with XRE-family HTH domain
MNVAVQRFMTPEGTEMVVLPAKDFDRMAALAADGEDVADARVTLARIDAGEGTMPGEVLGAILDDGLHPIAAWRRYRGLSQAELARRTGLSQVWLSRIESGGGTGSEATRRKVAEALEAPVWALEGEEADMASTDKPTKARSGSPDYDALTPVLAADGRATIVSAFWEIESVVGKLPASARKFDEWWQEAGHSHARAWINAGYRARPDRSSEKVTFFRPD